MRALFAARSAFERVRASPARYADRVRLTSRDTSRSWLSSFALALFARRRCCSVLKARERRAARRSGARRAAAAAQEEGDSGESM